jgi:hypothetical protein
VELSRWTSSIPSGTVRSAGRPRSWEAVVADGRLFLVCNACEEQLLLYKNYEDVAGYLYPEEKLLESFLQRHLAGGRCRADESHRPTYYEPPFRTESEHIGHWDRSVKRYEPIYAAAAKKAEEPADG